MKKVVMWTLYILAIAATILCFVFPVQAKEVSENIMNVLNTPIAIAGVSITIGGLLSLVISKYLVNNTKFGRKELDGIKRDFNSCEENVVKHAEKVDLKVEELENKYKELEAKCENQTSVMLEEFEDLQNHMLTALEAIPNRKVQLIIAEYKANYETKKAEIITKTINSNEYIDSKIAEMKAEFEEFMEKIKHEKEENNQATEE